ncbi:MAG TPA: CDP-alcohol phosphatidyltransferase family protein [Vicinamibacterales bacterium]|jgi:phosphatidylglycerophosphate synthase
MRLTFTDRTVRVHTSVLADAEKRLLVRIARALPGWLTSDQLTALGAAAMIGVGAAFWAGGAALLAVAPLLALNWFGDSLDGTLARVRQRERPRYGYYVDHVLDAVGVGALVAGMILGGHATPVPALLFLSAYYLLLTDVALATHARGTFRLAFWTIGPTELRIVLAAGALQLMRSETVTIAGRAILLFNAGCGIGAFGLILTFCASAIRNGVALYREERLPPSAPRPPHPSD